LRSAEGFPQEANNFYNFEITKNYNRKRYAFPALALANYHFTKFILINTHFLNYFYSKNFIKMYFKSKNIAV